MELGTGIALLGAAITMAVAIFRAPDFVSKNEKDDSKALWRDSDFLHDWLTKLEVKLDHTIYEITSIKVTLARISGELAEAQKRLEK